MAKRFESCVAWVTGGGSGIGRATALELAREGAIVAVSGRRADRLAEVVRDIEAEGGRGLAVPCDVTKDEDVKAAVARIVAELGRLDVAVANAGYGVMGFFETLSDAEWRRQFEVNVFGAASTARHALPELRKSKGRLAFIASVAGLIVGPKASAYSASKFALRALGLTLAAELHDSGVSVTTIHPGFVESEIALVDNAQSFRPDWKDTRPAKLMWPADRAAHCIVDAIAKRKHEYVFTAHGKVGAFLGKHFPGLVHLGTTRRAKRTPKPHAAKV